ncbi:UNVERIFIED_CONTAM: Copper-transporting ATPase HMA5 [Sesamum latifolium]|uniref:Copper-transporting ATPase HMA5 n=1 Tax=Sesamum latifolium TaxID=2727402 RepID=A0AAW2SM53_9LAMI
MAGKLRGYPVSSSDEEKCIQDSEAKAVFSVTGMTCSACSAAVEKAVKRLPGIKEAAVDVLNRAQVVFCPAFANVSMLLVSLLLFRHRERTEQI